MFLIAFCKQLMMDKVSAKHVSQIESVVKFFRIISNFSVLRNFDMYITIYCASALESILSGLLVKNYGRVCRKKSKSPNHWIFSK